MKVLIICGPTATGKTALALRMANFFPETSAELISADAGQLYRDLDIGTGKEVEALRDGTAQKGDTYWLINTSKVHLYDVIAVDEQFSAGRYASQARAVIAEIDSQGSVPIVVGGSGFYIQSLLYGIGEAGIGKDDALRATLAPLSVMDLQARLQVLDSAVFAALNNSDKANPRRLIRRIEIAQARARQGRVDDPLKELLPANTLIIGLQAPEAILHQRIAERVETMFALGLAEEIEQVLARGFSFADPGLQTIGYLEFAEYFSHKRSLAQVKQLIIMHTTQYAKRQMTYFRKLPGIIWFDISDPTWLPKLEIAVTSWYY